MKLEVRRNRQRKNDVILTYTELNVFERFIVYFTS